MFNLAHAYPKFWRKFSYQTKHTVLSYLYLQYIWSVNVASCQMCQILTDPDLQHCACIVYSNEGRLGFKIWLALCKKWLEFALKTEPFTLERIQWPGLRARYRCDRLGFCGYSDNILDSAAVLSQTAWLSAVMTAFSLTQRCHDSVQLDSALSWQLSLT